MAIYLNNGTTVTVGSVSLKVQSVTLNRQFDELDVTATGDAGHVYVGGLENSSVTIEFLNDDATVATLNGLAGTVASVTVTDEGGSYTFDALISQLTPVNGGVGDMSTQSVTWPISGTI